MTPEMITVGEDAAIAFGHISKELLNRDGCDIKQRSQYWAGALCAIVGYMAADTGPEAARHVLQIAENSLPNIHRGGINPVEPGGDA